MRSALKVFALVLVWLTVSAPGPMFLQGGTNTASSSVAPFLGNLCGFASILLLGLIVWAYACYRQPVVEVVFVLHDAPRNLTSLDAALIRSRFGTRPGSKGIARMIDAIESDSIQMATARLVSRGPNGAWLLYCSRISQLGIKKISGRNA